MKKHWEGVHKNAVKPKPDVVIVFQGQEAQNWGQYEEPWRGMGGCGDPRRNRTENEGSQALGLIWEVVLVLISKTEFVWSRTGGVLGRQVYP